MKRKRTNERNRKQSVKEKNNVLQKEIKTQSPEKLASFLKGNKNVTWSYSD